MADNKRLNRASRIWIFAAIVWFCAALRIGMLTDNRFHPDEALFATLARLIASGRDPLLADTSLLVDKPPLFYGVLAGGVAICWGCEIAARMPGLIASVISVALVARVSLRLWDSEVGAVVAGLIFALSAFAISFGATAFADPQMMMWLLAALAAISERRVGWSGFFFGFAFATKENAIFALPLVVGIGVVKGFDRGMGWGEVGRRIMRFAVPIGGVIAAMVVWEAARGSEMSFWDAAVQANNPGRLIRSSEVLPRLQAWWEWTRYIGGVGWITGGMIAGIGALAISEVRGGNQRGAAASFVLMAFGIGYWGLHWLVAFPVLDRYMLMLVPIVALLVGRCFEIVAESIRATRLRVATRWIIVGLIGVLLAPTAIRAMGSGFPIGGDHGGYDGIDVAAAHLRGLPEGSVVYHNGLGWSLGYYLLDAPVVSVSFDSPAALGRDLLAFGGQGGGRYLIRQAWESDDEIMEAVRGAGFEAEIELITRNRFGDESFVIYRLAAVQ